jgi:hypothetical protein
VETAIHDLPTRVLSSVSGDNKAKDVETPRFASWRGVGGMASTDISTWSITS